MPQGLQVWDSLGNLIVDTSMRLGTVLGTHTFYGQAFGLGSSISVPDLALGLPFYTLYSNSAQGYNPTVTIAGTTISWVFDFAGAPGSVEFLMVYGYY